jgi:hypothetical protein
MSPRTGTHEIVFVFVFVVYEYVLPSAPPQLSFSFSTQKGVAKERSFKQTPLRKECLRRPQTKMAEVVGIDFGEHDIDPEMGAIQRPECLLSPHLLSPIPQYDDWVGR